MVKAGPHSFQMPVPAALIIHAVRPSIPHDVDGLRSRIKTAVSYAEISLNSNTGGYGSSCITSLGFPVHITNCLSQIVRNIYKIFINAGGFVQVVSIAIDVSYVGLLNRAKIDR